MSVWGHFSTPVLIPEVTLILKTVLLLQLAITSRTFLFMVHDFILDIFQVSWHWDATASHNEEVLFIPLALGAPFLLPMEKHKNYQGMIPSNYLKSPKLTLSSSYFVYGQNSSGFHFLLTPSRVSSYPYDLETLVQKSHVKANYQDFKKLCKLCNYPK